LFIIDTGNTSLLLLSLAGNITAKFDNEIPLLLLLLPLLLLLVLPNILPILPIAPVIPPLGNVIVNVGDVAVGNVMIGPLPLPPKKDMLLGMVIGDDVVDVDVVGVGVPIGLLLLPPNIASPNCNDGNDAPPLGTLLHKICSPIYSLLPHDIQQ
jgi:hypothetical protein